MEEAVKFAKWVADKFKGSGAAKMVMKGRRAFKKVQEVIQVRLPF